MDSIDEVRGVGVTKSDWGEEVKEKGVGEGGKGGKEGVVPGKRGGDE